VAALGEGLRAVGADPEVVLRAPEHPFEYPADRVLRPLPALMYGLSAPLRRDVLHFQYGSTWVRHHLDARLAGFLHRTRVVTFHGDDCRLGEVAKELFPARGRVKSNAGDDATRARLAALARLCDAAVVNDFELATYVSPYFPRVYLLPVPVGGPTPPERRPRDPNRPPVIVHAPSDPVAKGTAAVEAAVETVAAHLPLEFRLLRGVPHRRVLAELEDADVVVDQLNSVATGIFALESMRVGLPVCGEFDRSVLAPFQADVPVVAVTAETLADELEALLLDPARRTALGQEGREFVERVHAANRVAAAALQVYAHAREAPPGLYVAEPRGIRAVEAALVERQGLVGSARAPRMTS